MCNLSLSKQFITGFFETDGGFIITFKKDARSYGGYRVQPQIKFTQKNTVILHRIAQVCKDMGIVTRFYEPKAFTKTTPYLLIEGFKACQKCMRLLDLPSLAGIKLYSYFIFKQLFSLKTLVLHNTLEGRKSVLDLKLQLHRIPSCTTLCLRGERLYHKPGCKAHKVESLRAVRRSTRFVALRPSLARAFLGGALKPGGLQALTGGYTRAQWETLLSLPPGSSLGAAQQRISCCAQAYWARFWRVVSCDPARGIPSAEYIRGLMAGDGSFSFTRGGKDKKPHPIFTLTIEKGSELVIFSTVRYFEDCTPRIYAARGCHYYRGERRELLARLAQLFVEKNCALPKKNFSAVMAALQTKVYADYNKTIKKV